MRYVIALAADYDYVNAAETTLKSIFYHTPHAQVYLANMDIPQEWFTNINQKLAGTGSYLHDLKVDVGYLPTGKVSRDHINDYSYVRLHLPRLLEADRILYLDSDTVVRQSLWPLLEIDLQGQPVGMVREISVSEFNSGVLLIDRAQWQKMDLTQRCIDFFSQHEAEINNGDQTVLNRVCEGMIRELPTTFNNQLGLEEILSRNHVVVIDDYLVEDAVIDHYLTSDKPWHLLSVGRGREQWWHYHNLEWQTIAAQQQLMTNALPTSSLLIFTAYDNLYKIEELLTALPMVRFEIAAPVYVSFKLKQLLRYPNVRIHQVILPQTLDRLIDESMAMLDLSIQRDEAIQRRYLATGKPVLSLQRPGYQNEPAQVYASVAALRQRVLELSAQ
ncbi:glycosyltransferase family 8 protein [Limosilactobacillus ingluviei]